MTYYVIHKGKKRGIFHSWEECKPHIFGCKKPIFKKFDNLEDAQHFLACGFGNKINDTMANMGLSINNNTSTDCEKSTDDEKYNIINLFTDGSLIRHTKTKLYCGFGIYIPKSVIFSQSVVNQDLLFHSIEIQEYKHSGSILENQTNNRAELTAIIIGLRQVLSSIVSNHIVLKSLDRQIVLNIQIMENMGLLNSNSYNNEKNIEYELQKPLIIKLFTDSKYSTLILDKTGEKYRKAGYIIKGEQVKNADLIDDIMKLKDLLKALSITLQVLHVFSHTNMNTFEANGNNIADVLANNGAKDSSNSRKNINGRRSYLSSSPQQIMENEKILTIPNNFNTTIKNDSFDNTHEIKINPFTSIKKKSVIDFFKLNKDI